MSHDGMAEELFHDICLVYTIQLCMIAGMLKTAALM